MEKEKKIEFVTTNELLKFTDTVSTPDPAIEHELRANGADVYVGELSPIERAIMRILFPQSICVVENSISEQVVLLSVDAFAPDRVKKSKSLLEKFYKDLLGNKLILVYSDLPAPRQGKRIEKSDLQTNRARKLHQFFTKRMEVYDRLSKFQALRAKSLPLDGDKPPTDPMLEPLPAEEEK